jgi:peptide chain release factor subunit 1
MELTTLQKRQIKKFIGELEKYKGRHTELVSVYVPKDYDLNKIINHLMEEQGTASNIKSKTTQKNVISALERMIQHLRLFKKTPENGLAIFAGNVAEREGQIDIQVWSVEPPIPLNLRIYRCDKDFVLEPLSQMLDSDDVFGLIVMDKREATIAMLKGKTIIPITKTTSNVPGKTRAGGQSAPRFQRLREGAAKEFYVRIAEYIKEAFLTKNIKGIIIGGPGHTKNEFLDYNYITDQLNRKIIAVKDLSYTGDFGLQELLDKSQDVLSDEEISKEKNIMEKFFTMLAKEPDKVAYGRDIVYTELCAGAVDCVLLSDSIDDETIEQFEEAAKEFGTSVVLISTDTREGVQLRDMGKVAAFLRYNRDIN